MTFDKKATILIDIELPDPEPFAPQLAEAVASLKVILVGWYAVPEQTSPEQARAQFAEEAHAALERMVETFRPVVAEVQTHLVFTGNELDTIERISAQTDSDAVLIPRPMDRVQRILVPLRGLHNARRIARFVAGLVQDGTTDVTLLHILEEGEEAEIAEDVLGHVSSMITQEGINAGLIRLRLKMADDPGRAIIDFAVDYDLVVIGETKPSVREVIFGSVPERIAQQVEVPVMVVRRR